MASNCKRDKKCLMFKANKPHFFKIILRQTINDGKLGIPKKFAREYGNDLSNQVILEVPTGAKWKIELVKCDDDKFWFQNGWKEFEEYYSLSPGSFLVFEHKSSSCFHVLIFDGSATEIDYPFSTTNCGEESNCGAEFQDKMKEETGDDVSVEILEDISGRQKRKEKSPLSSHRRQKMRRTILDNFRTSVLPAGAKTFKKKEDNFMSKANPQHFEAPRDDRGTSNQKQRLNGMNKRMQGLTADRKDKTLRRASTAFKSKNPFFMVAMQPSYVHCRYLLNIPCIFVKTYFKKEHGQVILGTCDGRTWTANYRCRKFKTQTKAAFYDLGWKNFVLDNNLEVGDVCVFELINDIEISLKIAIFRAKEDEICRRSTIHPREANLVKPNGSLVAEIESDGDSKDETEIPSNHGKDKVGQSVLQKSIGGQVTKGFAVADKFVSKYPFFKVVLKSYHFDHTNVTVPFRIIEKCIKHKEQMIALQIADRSWPVKLITYSYPISTKLSRGWAAFARDNSLQVQDVCVFELINSGVLKVTIFRKIS